MQNHHKQPEVWFSSTTSVVFMKGQTIQNAQKMMGFFFVCFLFEPNMLISSLKLGISTWDSMLTHWWLPDGSTKVFDILAELFNPRDVYLLPTLLQVDETQNLLK